MKKGGTFAKRFLSILSVCAVILLAAGPAADADYVFLVAHRYIAY